jgi:heat shock protein HslJ
VEVSVTARRAHRLFAFALVLGGLALGLPACSRSDAGPAGEPPAAPVGAPPQAGAPSEDELGHATYQGILRTRVTLVDGEWEGEPFAPGGASRPRVELVRGFRLAGDLDGDGSEEAVALLSENSGGSGTRGYLAVVGRRAEGLVNLGTALVGDRAQIRGGRISGRRIELDVVQAGPEDAACCPSQKAKRVWALAAEGLEEVASVVTGTLSLADLEGVEWALTHFSREEPAPPEPVITLVFEGERIAGSSGCNRYFAGVEAGEAPGELEIGPLGATRMVCPEQQMALEGRYLKALERVARFGFAAGTLVLMWGEGAKTGTLLFTPGRSGASDAS